MKKIRFALLSLLFTIILFAPFPKASATPAPSTSFILKQPDGATFRAYKRGDEYFHFTVDAEGRLIQKDKTGVWHYLKSSKNGLAFSGRADRYASPVDVTVDILSETDMKKAYVGLTGDTFVQVPRFINPPATLERIKKTQKLRQKKKSVDKQVSTLASIPIVMIVVGFRDCPYSDVYDWADKTFTGDYSVEKYYKDMSDNQFTFLPVEETSEYGSDGNTNINDAVNDGIIHVNLDIDHERWSELYRDETLTSLSNCLRKALTEASSYIDFSDYDADSDGYLSRTELALNFVIAGYDATSVPSDSNEEIYNQSIWPHQFDISHDPSDIPVLDGVEINEYTAIAEKNHILNTQNVFEIKQEMVGSLVHELAHILGLPDLYDTDINYDQALTKTKEWHSYSVDYLSLMAGGNYAYDSEADEYYPTSLDAWSKYYLGWTKPTIINSSQSISLNSNKSGKYNTAKVQNLSLNNPDEYYILENRSFTGWDKSLAYMYKECSGGIVAWHVDNTVLEKHLDSYSVNNAEHRPGVMPLFLEVGPTGYFSGPISSWSLYDKGFPLFTKSDLVKRGITSVPFILYGTGDNADKLNARALSHTSFTVSSDASDSMQVDIAVPEITPSVSSKTLYFAQSEAITKKYSSIDDDTFASVTNSDPSIVKAVISDGKLLVKGKRKEGTATLTILSENGLTATVTVTVKKGTVAKLKKTKGSVRLKKNLKIALKKGSYSGDKIYRCKSSNKKIAKVTNTGKITGKKKGKATITVTLLSGATKKFKVTVS